MRILIKFSNIVPIMLALCLMLLVTYYTLNYAGIIGRCLICDKHLSEKICEYSVNKIETMVNKSVQLDQTSFQGGIHT